MVQIGILIYWISLLKIARQQIFLPIWNLLTSDFPSESKHRPAAIKVKNVWGFRPSKIFQQQFYLGSQKPPNKPHTNTNTNFNFFTCKCALEPFFWL